MVRTKCDNVTQDVFSALPAGMDAVLLDAVLKVAPRKFTVRRD
jgi:hypothetical protein